MPEGGKNVSGSSTLGLQVHNLFRMQDVPSQLTPFLLKSRFLSGVKFIRIIIIIDQLQIDPFFYGKQS